MPPARYQPLCFGLNVVILTNAMKYGNNAEEHNNIYCNTHSYFVGIAKLPATEIKCRIYHSEGNNIWCMMQASRP